MSLRPRQQPQLIRQTIMVVCEGYLETTYFSAFQRHRNVRNRYALKPYCARGGRHQNVVKEAEERARNCGKGTAIWCIFDVESDPGCPQLQQSLTRCAAKGFRVGLSNPCFNVWAIAHRRNIGTGTLTSGDSLHTLEHLTGGRLEVHNTDWVLEQILGGRDFPNIKSALENIAHFAANQTGQILSKNPSTSVGELVQSLTDL